MNVTRWQIRGAEDPWRFNDRLHQGQLRPVIPHTCWLVASLYNSSHNCWSLSLQHRLLINLGKLKVLFTLLNWSQLFIKLWLWLLVILPCGSSILSLIWLCSSSPLCRPHFLSDRSEDFQLIIPKLWRSRTLQRLAVLLHNLREPRELPNSWGLRAIPLKDRVRVAVVVSLGESFGD